MGANKVKAAKAQTLKSEFEALCMKDNEPLDEFYLKLNSLLPSLEFLERKAKRCTWLKNYS